MTVMGAEPPHTDEESLFAQIRRHRLIQICAVTSLGLLISLTVARSVTYYIFALGLASLMVAMGVAYKDKVVASAYILLASMSMMLFALSLTGAGLFDMAILGYPGLLIFAALLGGMGLFLTVLFAIVAQCALLAWLTIQNIITPHTPSVSWAHLLFVVVILLVIGFSVFILVRDIKRLTFTLKKENTKVQQSREQIQHLARHDRLTGLPNRRYAETLFEQALRACGSHGQLALLFIDLDNFKPVNDAMGHAAGDELLIQLTQRLQNLLNENQYIIRFGGDEFVVLTQFTHRDELNPFAEALITACATTFSILQTQVVVSASMGIALAPKHGSEFKQLCRKADIAMYKAKEDGRNTYHLYTPSLDESIEEKFNLLQKLRPALHAEEFDIYYQPIIDLSTGNIVSVEALLRWPQADGTMISPDKFIPVAESSGLINDLGTWVLQRACLFCAQQRNQHTTGLRVSVNVSVVQFKRGDLNQIVAGALKQAALPPEALELEVTESLLMDDNEFIRQQLDALHKQGVSIVIDDFGTGYSNLGYLRSFHASKLKIDRSFVLAMHTSEHDASLVHAMIQIALSLDLETVAEGVENEQTLESLKGLGCKLGQGFHWSKPISAFALQALLQKECH